MKRQRTIFYPWQAWLTFYTLAIIGLAVSRFHKTAA